MSGLLNLFKKQKQVFLFTITIHQIVINFSKPVRISLIFQHRDFHLGKKRIESNKFPYSPSIGTVDLNETIGLQHTVFKEKSGVFKPKVLNVLVQAYLDNNISKKIAGFDLDIAEFCVLPIKNQNFQLKDSPDKHARIILSISAQPCIDFCDSVTGDSGTEGDLSNDSKNKKPPISKSKVEENFKITQLELNLADTQRERDELQVKLRVKGELFENEKEKLLEQLAELDEKNSELQASLVKAKKRKIEYKKSCNTLKANNDNLKNRINELEEEMGKLECHMEKYRIRKRGMKEQMKEILAHEQKLSQELVQIQTLNSELNKKIKGSNDSKTDIENFETRSRRNTDIVGTNYLAQLRQQVQVLEDQKQAALTTQTELTFTIQKMKTQYLELEQKNKLDIMRFNSEISNLKLITSSVSESNLFQVHSIKSPPVQNHSSPSDINTSISNRSHQSKLSNPGGRKGKIYELIKNVRELKSRKEEAESALKLFEGTRPIIHEEDLESSTKERNLQKNLQELGEQLESTKKLLRFSQKEVQTLTNKLKLLSESQTSDSTINLLHDQLISCENELEKVNNELSLSRSKHFAEINMLLEQNSSLKEKIKEREKRFQAKLEELVQERDFVIKTSQFSE